MIQPTWNEQDCICRRYGFGAVGVWDRRSIMERCGIQCPCCMGIKSQTEIETEEAKEARSLREIWRSVLRQKDCDLTSAFHTDIELIILGLREQANGWLANGRYFGPDLHSRIGGEVITQYLRDQRIN